MAGLLPAIHVFELLAIIRGCPALRPGMTSQFGAGMSEFTPWLLLIALGAFHGLNPAMGWLFAVALGLYRHSRAVVLISLLPIALGHALAIAVVVYAVVVAGMAIDEGTFRILSGLLLIS